MRRGATVIDIFERYPAFRNEPRGAALLCALLRERGCHADALALGIAATEAAPASTAVREAVTSALSPGVAKFHVPMLLDHARNRAYATAIERAVRPGMTVLEIGTGAGLLAMVAARAGAIVVTCEEHPMIAAAAAEIVARNGLADRIRIVPKRSTELRIPDDLPARADLVIHEIFGSSLFDEGVTMALADARHRLLAPGAPSVPPRAAIRCALVREGRPRDRRALRDVEGFDLSPFALLARSTMSASASRLLALERASATHRALEMDYDAGPPFGAAAETVEIASLGGRVDGLLQWIEIGFGDGEVLTNDPFVDGPPSSWGARYLPLADPRETAANDRFDVTLRHRGVRLMLEVTPELRTPPGRDDASRHASDDRSR